MALKNLLKPNSGFRPLLGGQNFADTLRRLTEEKVNQFAQQQDGSQQQAPQEQELTEDTLESLLFDQSGSEEGVDDALAQIIASSDEAQAQQDRVRPEEERAIQRTKGLEEVLQNPNLTENQKLKIGNLLQKERRLVLAERKVEASERKVGIAEQRVIQKETQPFFKKVNESGQAAKDSNLRLDRMQTLLNRGRLTPAAIATIFRTVKRGIPKLGIGLNLDFLMSADTQEFEKLSADFVKDAKKIFGPRLTDFDIKSFMKTVPNITQSNPAKQRVINNLRIFNEASSIKQKAMREIIKTNGGKRPRDINARVDKVTKPKLDVLAKKFKESPGPQTVQYDESFFKRLFGGITTPGF